MASSSTRSTRARPVLEAAQEAPAWARLTERLQASEARLRAILPLLPVALRSHLQAGPLEMDDWCLLVSSNAVAAKLRQLLPSLRLHLDTIGLPVKSIRLRIHPSVGQKPGR